MRRVRQTLVGLWLTGAIGLSVVHLLNTFVAHNMAFADNEEILLPVVLMALLTLSAAAIAVPQFRLSLFAGRYWKHQSIMVPPDGTFLDGASAAPVKSTQTHPMTNIATAKPSEEVAETPDSADLPPGI